MVSKKIKGGVTAAKGFLAAGIHAGVKPAPTLDLALVFSQAEGPIAGVFTKNQLAAAPVIVDRGKLQKGRGRAIIINSGNANACTGKQGLRDAKAMATSVAQQLKVSPATVYVGSTGIIGRPLPIRAITQALPHLVRRLRRSGHTEAAQAIMTTDTKPKEAAFQTRIGKQIVTIGGMAKGSGMIHPDMATMLAFLTTDVAIDSESLQQALMKAVDQSFNCLSVDGETSPNDTVLCLANTSAGNPILKLGSARFNTFQNLLNQVCLSLALQVIRDGEGCTKCVKIQVEGTKTTKEAKQVAQTIATSPLVKTALFGEDPNWGRILAAIGRSGIRLLPNAISLRLNGVPLVKYGLRIGPHAEKRAQRIMKRKQYSIRATLGRGPGFSHIWTTDLSFQYIEINSSYPS